MKAAEHRISTIPRNVRIVNRESTPTEKLFCYKKKNSIPKVTHRHPFPGMKYKLLEAISTAIANVKFMATIKRDMLPPWPD